MRRLIYLEALTLICALVLMVRPASGQAVLMNTTGSYPQNFNTLISSGSGTWTDNSTIPNWYAKRTGTGTSIASDAGATTRGNLYSYGTVTDSERSLGAIGSDNAAALNFAWGILLKNTSGGTISDIRISYTGEQWRNGGATEPQTVSFYYIISGSQITDLQPNTFAGWTHVAALDFTSPVYSGTTGAALDGNAAANKINFVNVSIPALTLYDNDYILLKWDDPNHTGNDHGLSIDDVTISWSACITPAVQASNIISNATTSNSIALKWTNGDGYNRMVKMNTVNPFTPPVDGTSYPANPVYSGSGEQVVYNGSDNNINISGLNPLTQYCFRVYEYNCSIYLQGPAINNPTCITTASSACTPTFSTIAFQGGEGTIADNWNFLPITPAANVPLRLSPGININFPRTGSYSIRAGGGSDVGCVSGKNCITGGTNTAIGCPMNGNVIEFNNADVSCYTGVQLEFYHRSELCVGSGFEAGDNLNVDVKLNNGSWTQINTMTGNSDYVWLYTTSPAGEGTTMPNPIIYNVPDGTNQFAFRVRGTISRSDELFYIDDVKLTGTTICGPSFTLQPLDQSVCEGNATGFTVDATGTGDIHYQWQLFSGSTWNDLSNGGSYSGVQTKTLTINPATPGMIGSQYKCIASSACGTPAISLTVTLSVNLLPIATATSNSPVCQGNTINLTGGPDLMTDYLWTGPDFASGAQSPSITNATPAANSGNYALTVTDGNGCYATSAGTYVTVNVLPIATITPGGPTTFCPGDYVVLTASEGSSYLWSTGETTREINAIATGSYTVTVSDANGCSATSAATDIIVLDVPTIDAQPPSQTVCSGDVFTITLTSDTPETSFNWSRDETVNLIGMTSAGSGGTTEISGALTNLTNIQLTSTFLIVGALPNECLSNPVYASVTVNPPPDVAAISGPTVVCEGLSITLSSSPGGGVWTSSNPAIAIVNSSTGVVTGVASGSTIITYTITDGCSNSMSTSINVDPSPTVTALVNNLPFVTICPGQPASIAATGSGTTPTTVSFTNSSRQGFGYYVWLGPLDKSVTVSGLPNNLGAITNITVTVNISHQHDDEVEIYLDSPGGLDITNLPNGNYTQTISPANTVGGSIALSANQGGSGANYRNTVFSDAAVATIAASGAIPPFTGIYKPEIAFSTINATTNPNGTWTLRVVDEVFSWLSGVFNSFTISFTYGISSGTYAWSSVPSGFTGSGTGPFTVTPAVTTDYTVRLTNPNGCYDESTVKVTVNPLATINLTSGTGTNIQALCIGTALNNITYAIGGSGTGATVTGLPPGVAGDYNAGVFTISGSPSTTGTFNYTVTTASPCTNSSLTGTITIYPYPVTNGATVCQGKSGSLTSSSTCPSLSSGPKDAGTGSNGVGTVAWTNPGNAITNNNSYATRALSNQTSNYLRTTNYGFSIPINATITGITVTIGRYENTTGNGNDVRDVGVYLLKAGLITGTNKANTTLEWEIAETPATYGGPTDLWGTTWTPAEIIASSFGVSLHVNSTNNRTASVDYMQVTINYTVPGMLNWYTASSGGSPIGSGTPFNPVGVAGSGLPDTNTPGTYTFFAECSTAPGCRTATNFIIYPNPVTSLIFHE